MAHAYIRLAVALGEHDADSLDYYIGPPEWVADIRRSAPGLSEIRASALDAARTLEDLPTPDPASQTRKRFLLAQLRAVACRASPAAIGPGSFDRETQCEFGVTAPAQFDETTLGDARARLARLLPGRGPLAQRLGAFESRFAIPPVRVGAVMERAIAGCRAQTARHMSLPPDESIELRLVSQEPWAGYSLYLGGHKSVVSINLDFPVTIDRALDLACHEAYPGHHTWNLTQDDALAKRGAIEMVVQPTYSPQSFQSESAAAIASEIAFPPGERARFERAELFPRAGIAVPTEAEEMRYLQVEQQVARLQPAVAVVARRYLDGELEFARAEQALEAEALMPSSFEFLKYLNEFRSYIVTYTCGPEFLNRSLAGPEQPGGESQRWNTYLHWMTAESTSTPSAH